MSGYGLTPRLANILVEDKDTVDYFEAFCLCLFIPSLPALWLITQMATVENDKAIAYVKNLPLLVNDVTPTHCANFIINDLFAMVKKHKIKLKDIPVCFACILFLYRKNGLITNTQLKDFITSEIGRLP